ncbi:receptor like protein 21 [Quercus suber]|uniref:Receptor like protein 21 n=1 Tax=Quercus suber TaxID=58331 RepID=A0AAW0IJW4_QUESU
MAHNNLSDNKLPDFEAQFATFGTSCYEGNPFLCGPPLEKSCTEIVESTPSPQNSSKASEGKWYAVDLLVFSISIASVLYINLHWRQQCFNLVEDRICPKRATKLYVSLDVLKFYRNLWS